MNNSGTRIKRKFLGLFLTVWCIGCSSTVERAERSVGTRIDDRLLEGIIKRELAKEKDSLTGSNINVSVFYGRVLLTGQVRNREISTRAQDIATSLSEVKDSDISNHLRVLGPISLVSRSNDLWLAAKVRAKLLSNKNSYDSPVRVTCENGTIYLMGRLNREESERITELVSRVFGVEQIVKIFTYL